MSISQVLVCVMLDKLSVSNTDCMKLTSIIFVGIIAGSLLSNMLQMLLALYFELTRYITINPEFNVFFSCMAHIM